MDEILSPSEKQNIITCFLDIAFGQTIQTARQFLQATSWNLDEAIQLFFVENEGGTVTTSSYLPLDENKTQSTDQSSNGSGKDMVKELGGQDGCDDVRPPLPVIRESLYADSMLYELSGIGHPSHGPSSVVAFHNFDDEVKRLDVWKSEQGGPSGEKSTGDNLAALYRPPFALMHQGPFEKAKLAAVAEDKWLLANLQSTTEFSSHMLNRDTWANEAVAQTIKTNFIFWQVYDDASEGKKVCTYYKIDSVPAVLVVDPITGQKMCSWNGMVHPDRLLEDLLPFMDGGPKDPQNSLSHKRPGESSRNPSQNVQGGSNEEDEELQRALAASMEIIKQPGLLDSEENDNNGAGKGKGTSIVKKLTYPLLPEEPKGDKSLVCRVGIRLPDGRRVQRNFLRSDPIQLLWSFCSAQLGEAETRSFCLTHAIPGASKSLDYDCNLSFEESGLSHSMISATWE